MNTVEKTTTGVSPAELILSHAITLSSHIMAPVAREEEPANIALAERMEGLIERQHTLLIAAQENQHRADQHRLVLHNPDITEYPINSYVLYTPSIGRDNKLIPQHKGPYQVRGSFNGQAHKDSYTQLASLHIRSCLHQSNQYCPTELTTVHSETNIRIYRLYCRISSDPTAS